MPAALTWCPAAGIVALQLEVASFLAAGLGLGRAGTTVASGSFLRQMYGRLSICITWLSYQPCHMAMPLHSIGCRREQSCQPNFRRHVHPDPVASCGPYTPDALQPSTGAQAGSRSLSGSGSIEGNAGAAVHQGGWPSATGSHDTLAMVAIAADGSVAAGASSNGAIHKIPGRVGDAAVPGGGAYADSEVGGCGSTGEAMPRLFGCVTAHECCRGRSAGGWLLWGTGATAVAALLQPRYCTHGYLAPLTALYAGDGDTHLAFLPCFTVVELMRQGRSPHEAAEEAVRRMARHRPGYVGAVVAASRDGSHGAAAFGWSFAYSVVSPATGGRVQVVQVAPLQLVDGRGGQA